MSHDTFQPLDQFDKNQYHCIHIGCQEPAAWSCASTSVMWAGTVTTHYCDKCYAEMAPYRWDYPERRTVMVYCTLPGLEEASRDERDDAHDQKDKPPAKL